MVFIQHGFIMTLGEQKRVGKKHTIRSIAQDLQNGAWNNLDLSKSSKRAIANAGGIVLFGIFVAFSQISRNNG